MFAIELENVHKAYDGVGVLRGLNLRVAQGQIYGLLGPNGAGKSTLLRLLLGFVRPQQGRIRLLGSDNLAHTQARIGYLPERLQANLHYTGREYLRFLGSFSDMRPPELTRRVADELDRVGLSAVADRQIRSYSRGMLQRLGIAQAVLHAPDLLLIDEPSGGLDAAGRGEMIALLADVRQRGCTILLTTHYFGEVDDICDRVGILYDGRIAAEIDVAALRTPSRDVAITVGGLSDDLRAQLEHEGAAVRCTERLVLLDPNTAALQARVIGMLLAANVPILALQARVQPLADMYTQVVRGTYTGDTQPLIANATGNAAPPNGLFAPPGHPDAPQNGRTPTGDTLLRELLQREKD